MREGDQSNSESLSEANDTITYLSNEVNSLREIIAFGGISYDDRITARSIIDELKNEISELESELIDLSKQAQILKATNDSLIISRDIYQRENNELKTQCKMYQNMLKKAGNVKA